MNHIFQSMPARRDAIYQLLIQQKTVSVRELSEKFHVSEMTVRRDFEYLEKKGLLEHIHGGAILATRYSPAPLFSQKSLRYVEEKKAIASVAATLVRDYDTVFLNSGTTTMRLFPFINAKHIRIITNNPCIPLSEIPENIEIISTGGSYNTESFTLVGGIAETTVKSVWATKSFLGIDGIDIACGLTTPVHEESCINKLMIERTRGKVVIVADSSKIGRVSNFCVAPISEVDILVTDSNISENDKNLFIEQGLQVIVAAC